jgi:hypothetical protein
MNKEIVKETQTTDLTKNPIKDNICSFIKGAARQFDRFKKDSGSEMDAETEMNLILMSNIILWPIISTGMGAGAGMGFLAGAFAGFTNMSTKGLIYGAGSLQTRLGLEFNEQKAPSLLGKAFGLIAPTAMTAAVALTFISSGIPDTPSPKNNDSRNYTVPSVPMMK